MPDMPHVKDAIAAIKATAPPDLKRITSHGVDDDGTLMELDMRRASGGRWLVIERRKKVNG